ncbi:hypothetical protein [Veillonella magna]|uniref:hypothetical protein n=1 Tax=Veillonella magna TaxID=464322 RepID=UPI0023F2EDEF|nr:hypothetical protein [Veillonella magna]
MIAVNKLKALIVEKGYTQIEVAKKLGINDRSFRNRLKKGVLNSNEILILIEILGIEDPVPIFFTNEVS